MINYTFKWELTTNCTYNCPFCALHGQEQYSTKETYNKVLNFFLITFQKKKILNQLELFYLVENVRYTLPFLI